MVFRKSDRIIYRTATMYFFQLTIFMLVVPVVQNSVMYVFRIFWIVETVIGVGGSLNRLNCALVRNVEINIDYFLIIDTPLVMV